MPEISECGKPAEEYHGFKLGWIQGVLIPCLLNIWGVMLFLRMPWIVAESGIFQATVIIVISTIICGLTTLSLSALCTNGVVKGGKFCNLSSNKRNSNRFQRGWQPFEFIFSKTTFIDVRCLFSFGLEFQHLSYLSRVFFRNLSTFFRFFFLHVFASHFWT